MKKRTTRIISIIIVVVVVLSLCIPLLIANAAEDESANHDTDWMSQIDDYTKLSEISIPGAHDSATQYSSLSFCTSCQDLSMADQMKAGYRYIDARLEINDAKDGFVFTHGGYKCRKGFWPWSDKITFTDLANDAYSFLDANPSETVIISIKFENSEDDVALGEQLVMDEIAKNQDKWYTTNAIPTLGDVRGKIVLATRFEDKLGYGDERTGLHFYWENQDNEQPVDPPYALSMINNSESLWVQDRYKYTEQDKINAFTEGIENCQASDNSFFINFLSLSGQGLIPHPKGNANTLNKLFKEIELQPSTSYGIIVIDRATSELAQKIYNTNF